MVDLLDYVLCLKEKLKLEDEKLLIIKPFLEKLEKLEKLPKLENNNIL